MDILNNLPNNGYDLCECGHKMINRVCSNPNCPTKGIYENGYRAKAKGEQYPIIEIE